MADTSAIPKDAYPRMLLCFLRAIGTNAASRNTTKIPAPIYTCAFKLEVEVVVVVLLGGVDEEYPVTWTVSTAEVEEGSSPEAEKDIVYEPFLTVFATLIVAVPEKVGSPLESLNAVEKPLGPLAEMDVPQVVPELSLTVYETFPELPDTMERELAPRLIVEVPSEFVTRFALECVPEEKWAVPAMLTADTPSKIIRMMIAAKNILEGAIK